MQSDQLPAQEAVIYRELKAGGDVHVLHLYESVTGRKTHDHVAAQHYLSRYIRRLNLHLGEDEAVGRGSLRATYRLLKNR